MKKTLAAVAAGFFIVAAGPALAGGHCGSFIQSVEGNGDHKTVAQSDQVTTSSIQTATTQTATTQTAGTETAGTETATQ